MKAISVVGDGKWSQPMNFRTASDIPTGFPTLIRAEALTSQSIRVIWQAPTSGINGPFLGYREFCISGNDRRESTVTPQQTSHTFSGLRKWTVYNVTVVVRNDKGDGPRNAYVTRRTSEDTPGQLQNFQVTVLNSTGIRLNWALPHETNGIIRGFKLRYEKKGNSSEKDLPGNTTLSYVLTGLDKCTQYSFTMLTYTIKDGPSTPAILKTTAEDVPGPPVHLNIQATKKREISLTWQKPESVTEEIETYTILFDGKKDYNSSFVHSGRLTVSSTTKEIPNLYPGTRYTFRVSATTGCGEGDNSSPSSSTTKVDAPATAVVGLVDNITAEVNNITVWESSDINGQVKAYQIIVVKVYETCSFDETKLKSYEQAEKEEISYYIAAEITADPGKSFPRVFTLGDEKEYNGYKNVKIKFGKTYNVLQRALTQVEKKGYLKSRSTLIARGKIPENKETFPREHSQTGTSGIDSSVFAVSLAFNAAFLVVIVLIVVHDRKLKKQLDEMKKVKSRDETAFTQDIYSNAIANNREEGLAMAPLPTAQAGSTYEQIDLHGTVDPSDVKTEVTSSNTIAADEIGRIYESITEESKSNPNVKIYETIHPETQAQNPKQLEHDTVSSSQSTYQSLVQENQTKPVYESLHTKTKMGPIQECVT